MCALKQSFEVFPEDVLGHLMAWQDEGCSTALAIIRDTIGGGVRSPGTIMAVCNDGRSSGYLSGGCIDSDVILRAEQVIGSRQVQSLTYGLGSPFIDLPLPCGGSIEIEILPVLDLHPVRELRDGLIQRAPAKIDWRDVMGTSPSKAGDNSLEFDYAPRLRLRIAGRGADCLATAALANQSGYDVHLQLPDKDDIARARALGLSNIDHLTSIADLPKCNDDEHTAFVLMFHDRYWEVPLLAQALNGDAFYVGAVGSRRTHAKRVDPLLKNGCTAEQVASIHAPIGMIEACRDASSLAISVIGEILDQQKSQRTRPTDKISGLVLAAGQSSRFERGDKLLADLNGQTVMSSSLKSLEPLAMRSRLAVIGGDHEKRASIAKAAGWTTIQNPEAKLGQSTSLKLGIQMLSLDPEVDGVLISLADMPFVPIEHYQALINAFSSKTEAVMTRSNGILMPPAIFSKSCFEHLMSLDGDRGAGQIFKSLSNTAIVELAPEFARDIDTVEDLNELEPHHG